MVSSKVPAGYVPALVECPRDEALIAAASDLLRGEHPIRSMSRYAGHEAEASDGGRGLPGGLQIEPVFGAIPIGRGVEEKVSESLRAAFREPDKSERFL